MYAQKRANFRVKIFRCFPALFLRTRDSPSGAHRTLLVDEFVPIIGALGLTVRADALDTFRGQFRLLLGNEIRQSLACAYRLKPNMPLLNCGDRQSALEYTS